MFFYGQEGQEETWYQQLDTALGKLPVPVIKPDSKMSHADALEGGFIPTMDEEQ